MKKYIFITTAILFFICFASCSSTTSCKSESNCESNCLNVHVVKLKGNKRYEIVTFEDSVKMKRYTIFVCTATYGCGCTLIDTEDIK